MGRRRARLWALFQRCNPKAKAKTRKDLASAHVLEAERPEEFPTPEGYTYREQLCKAKEEIAQLKAERNNTRLLLEHLECLVSRHIPPVGMTTGKRQAQSPAGMRSEVEVLRALKWLFEHHKALDEKQMILSEENNQEKILTDRVLDVHHEQENMPSANGKRPSDGSLSHKEDMVKKMELQEIIERQLREQSQMEERLAALSAHVKHLEEDLDTARKDLLKSKNMNRKLEQDIRETEDKNRQLQERLELVEKLQQRLRRAETLPEVEAEQAQRVASLSKDQLILNLETLRAEVDQTRPRGAPFHHSRPHLGSAPDLRFPVADRPADSLGNGAVLRCPQKGRLAALHDEPSEARTPPPPSHPWWAPCEAPAPSHCGPEVQTRKEQDCERTQQASMLADVAQAFESDESVSDDEGDRVTLFSSATQLSPSRQANAKTLTVMMQEQLDIINEEIRLIEEEKENTEQRAEETESREGRGSLGSLRRFKSVSSLNLLSTSSHADSCPPLPKPRRRQHSLAQEGDQLGIMTLMILSEENNQEKILTDRVLDVHHEQENMPSANGKRPSDGSLSHKEDMVKKMELQEIIERQLREQSQMEERLAALSAHVKHLEEDLDTARKDLLKSKDMNRKLERDIRETEDKNRQLQERLELVEKLQQRLRRAETLPEVEAEQAQRVASLSKDQLILNLETLRAEVDQTRLRGAPFHHSRPHLGSAPDLRFPVADRPADSLGNGAALRCPQKGRLAALHDEPSEVQTPKEQDWERTQKASMLADVAQAFESDEGVSDDEGDRVTLFSSATQLSPGRQADAKTLTVMMQEQLDAINEEIRLIEEEKENTEQRAEETESREDRGSLGSLRRFKSVSSLNLLPTSSHAGSCPPLPKPRTRRHSLAQEGDQLGIMTLGDTRSSLSEDLGVPYGNHCERMTLELRLPAIREEVGDDKTAIKCETSTLAWPRSLRMGRLRTGALRTATHEDLRDAHNSTGSQDSPGNNPSSSTSSQGSLHKAPKKKGIKSSISRLFRKKEKGRPEHPSKEALGPGPADSKPGNPESRSGPDETARGSLPPQVGCSPGQLPSALSSVTRACLVCGQYDWVLLMVAPQGACSFVASEREETSIVP
ncbi:liprin-alpha-1-like isoform X4 [Bos indicus]|uniref:Liprin-alpha-1-like isoform X4 n=1 Tax=Bos indicus TaxID=9915 RepID=A0ABM4S1E9_BOSIN